MTTTTITNPVTGERFTFLETSSESGGARTMGDLEIDTLGGVPGHTHDAHDECIEVLEGEIEVVMAGVKSRLRAGERVVIPRGTPHSWRNPSPDHLLKFRGSMTPGHPGFETALKVMFGLARDGQARPNGVPKRFGDAALIADWNQGGFTGLLGALTPLFRWSARREKARGRDVELLRRYG